MKPLRFLGNSLECLREFPKDVRHNAGYQLEQVQRGKPAKDFKPMPSVGMGVEELRVSDDSGTYRVLYLARLAEAVYVLHAFQKKTRATSTLNRDKAVTGVFAGDLDEAHAAGCAFVKRSAMVAVPRPFVIVVTSNSGYPLDLNLYQSVKGLRAADQVVRQGGAIILAARCSDGIPDHGLYGKLLRGPRNPRQLLDKILAPGFLEQDQWQAHTSRRSSSSKPTSTSGPTA